MASYITVKYAPEQDCMTGINSYCGVSSFGVNAVLAIVIHMSSSMPARPGFSAVLAGYKSEEQGSV